MVHDLTSVRTLITSVSALAQHLKVSNNAIYRWIKVNRIPGGSIIKVANFYDVELNDLIHLTGSELSHNPVVRLKQRDTLPTLVKVKKGTLTLDEAATQLDQPKSNLKKILMHWGDQLEALLDTMLLLESKTITLDQAAMILGLAKYTVHGIRRKYGFAPGSIKSSKAPSELPKRKEAQRTMAIEVIAGRKSAAEAAAALGVHVRTIYRAYDGLCKHSVHELSHWPVAFRHALAEEVVHAMPPYAATWLAKAEANRLVISKYVKYEVTLKNVKQQPLKRLLVAVLTGEMTLDEVAAARGGDPVVLSTLFTGDIKGYGVTYNELADLPVAHQIAFAELLMWELSRKRRFVE